MKNKSSSILVLGIFISLVLIMTGTEVKSAGTKKVAVNMVHKAVAYYKKHGKEKTIAAVQKKNGLFHKGEVFVYLFDLEGRVLAHPTSPGVVGQLNPNLRDPDGVYFVKEIVQCANEKGSCWVKYKITNPKTKKIQQKLVYCEKAGDMIFICGIYL